MPEMNGVQLLNKVKQINSEVTTMLISELENLSMNLKETLFVEYENTKWFGD
jgi:hypothetical protein